MFVILIMITRSPDPKASINHRHILNKVEETLENLWGSTVYHPCAVLKEHVSAFAMKVLLTGAAGFVGAATTQRLLERGDQVIGIDNFSDYYDHKLKVARVNRLSAKEGFTFIEMDCTDQDCMAKLFQQNNFDTVIHLAAQPGVRYSLENPFAYLKANLNGFLTVLEGCRHNPVKHLVYASSSSVYGGNEKLPYAIADNVEHPISLYAATKKSNEQVPKHIERCWNEKWLLKCLSESVTLELERSTFH